MSVGCPECLMQKRVHLGVPYSTAYQLFFLKHRLKRGEETLPSKLTWTLRRSASQKAPSWEPTHPHFLFPRVGYVPSLKLN